MEFLPRKPDEREAAIKEKLYTRLESQRDRLNFLKSLPATSQRRARRAFVEEEIEFLSELLDIVERS